MKPKDVLNLAAPQTWAGSIAPATVGLAVSYQVQGHLDLMMAVCFYLIVLLMQSAVNAFDDYADFVKGTDTLENSPDAEDAVIVYGMPARWALRLGFLFLILAAIPAVYVVMECGVVPLAIGLTGALVLFCYAFGKYPISYLPLGELLCGFVMGGLIPLAGFYMQTRVLDWHVLYLTIPPMLGMAVNMFSNNGCDIDRDLPAGRRTLACLMGLKRTAAAYRFLLILWVLSPAIILATELRWTGVLVYLLELLAYVHLVIRQYRHQLGPQARDAVMTGATTLVSLVAFTYSVAILVG